MGKMLGGDEEKDPDAAKKEEERREALRQEEEERKAKYAKMEAEREAVRQGIRDKVGAAAARHRGPGPGWGCCLREGWAKPGWAAARPPPRLAERTSRRAPRGGGGRGRSRVPARASAHAHRAWGSPCGPSPPGSGGGGWTPPPRIPGWRAGFCRTSSRGCPQDCPQGLGGQALLERRGRAARGWPTGGLQVGESSWAGGCP